MYNLYLATPMELPAQTQGLRFSSLNLQDLPIHAKSVGVSSVISIFETASEVLWKAWAFGSERRQIRNPMNRTQGLPGTAREGF